MSRVTEHCIGETVNFLKITDCYTGFLFYLCDGFVQALTSVGRVIDPVGIS
jgi:hypothetical protein